MRESAILFDPLIPGLKDTALERTHPQLHWEKIKHKNINNLKLGLKILQFLD